MPELVDAAAAILAQANHRAELIGENLANSTTPAYKARVAFSALLADGTGMGNPAAPQVLAGLDLRPGKLVNTGNPHDFAIAGTGFFAVQRGETLHLTRAGRFSRRDDGRLVDGQGGVLQGTSGADVVATEPDFELRPDGRIVAGGAEVGRVAVYRVDDPDRLVLGRHGAATTDGDLLPSDDVHLVQGVYEASNVSTGEEMVRMMQALRMAEAGQRVAMTYDDLMGRAITTFGESVR